jgi:DNA-binding NarL/FixJ family response regulator
MPIRILIADDHAVFRGGLKALLEKETDMKIVADAGDGFEAAREAIRRDGGIHLTGLI